MRHRNAGRKLNRTPAHRLALFKNLARALVQNGRIKTTVAKAKTLRGIVEPLVTLALRADVHARRQALAVLGDRKLVSRLFDEIGPLYTSTGGYTRVVKLAQLRKGDAAPLAFIEFTKQPEPKPSDKEVEGKGKKSVSTAQTGSGES